MYFLYLKSTGAISVPIRSGKPDERTLNKEADCGIGSGVKWENVDLFYAPDEEFADDFKEWAAEGKYYISNDEVKENLKWVKPEEPEWR